MRILDVVRSLGVGDSLEVILDRITRAVVDVLGFEAVVVNVKVAGDGLVVKTAVGPPEVRDLVGETMSHETWIALLAACERWGELRFHENLAVVDVEGDISFRDPDRRHYLTVEADEGERLWQPEYALLAPMWAGDDELLGVLSVDLPVSGRVPDYEQCEMLELFAGQAGVAIAEAARIGTARDEQLQYRVVFLDSPIPTGMLGLDSTFVEVNAAFEELVGRTNDDLVGSDIASVFADVGADGVDRLVRRTDDDERWAHVRVQVIEGTSGTRYVCTAEDRTSAHHELDYLRMRAERDDLTGLGVRSLAMTELAERMTTSESAESIAFLYCDLDGFKSINDDYGHLVGDQVLVEIAARIERCAGNGDLVCRLGGDEFGIVATRSTVAEIENLAERCVDGDSLGSGHSAKVGMSVGVCVVHPQASVTHEPEVVVESADSMLYLAKSEGGRTWRTTILE